jgi:hypothetical protein
MPYILFPGVLSWVGFSQAQVLPAMALIPIVPFLPTTGGRESGATAHPLPEAEGDYTAHYNPLAEDSAQPHASTVEGDGAAGFDSSALERFETDLFYVIEIGRFLFGMVNASVSPASLGPFTWVVLAAIVVGNPLGLLVSTVGLAKAGWQPPEGITVVDLAVAGGLSSVSLTMPLFTCSVLADVGVWEPRLPNGSFWSPDWGDATVQPGSSGLASQAKLGALLASCLVPVLIAFARLVGMHKPREPTALDRLPTLNQTASSFRQRRAASRKSTTGGRPRVGTAVQDLCETSSLAASEAGKFRTSTQWARFSLYGSVD